MYEKDFGSCKTIAEVYAKARDLKANGENQLEVNTAASKRKKELITSSSQVNSLTRITPKASSRQGCKVSSIMMDVKDLNSGKITITKSNKVII